MKKYEVNRKMYKDIKKMDHGQMNAFCQSLYTRGYEAGKKDSEGLSEHEVLRAILGVKGIGEKKAGDIVSALTKAHEEKVMLTDG